VKFLSIAFLLLLANSTFALEVPFLSGRIIDEAGILDTETKELLEEKLKAHEKETTNQIVVLIIPSLEGEVLEEYSLKVASTWKLGQKKKDNGVLLLIAKDDRLLRIEVGYGLEGVLTDALSSRIIRKEITPSFKRGNFSLGVKQGVDAILGSISGEYNPPKEGSKEEYIESYLEFVNSLGGAEVLWQFRLIFGGVFFVVITPFTLFALFAPYIGWFIYFFLFPFYGTFPLVALGKMGALALPIYAITIFLLKIFVGFTSSGKNFAKKYGSNFIPSGGGSGRSSSSGSSWSSSSSSGGFSGGGGSFGGGGSSGSW
jgi:uncharacterized protein